MNDIYLFDIDGTLSDKGKIPQSAIKAISKLRSQGNLVVLATGRCLGQMDKILDVLEVDGFILNNGALVILHNEILFDHPISKETIVQMIKDGLHIALLSKDKYVRIENHFIFEKFVQYFNISLPELVSQDYIEKNEIYSLGVYDECVGQIHLDKYPDLRFVLVCPMGYDVMPKDINKASGFSSLRERFPEYRLIAFGDNYNDIEMLQSADIAVAMSHAPKEVLTVADYIAKEPLEDGIYWTLKQDLKSIE